MKGELKELALIIKRFSEITIISGRHRATFYLEIREEFKEWLDAFKKSLDEQTVNGRFIPKENLIIDIKEAQAVL